jgi:hypothetical protein
LSLEATDDLEDPAMTSKSAPQSVHDLERLAVARRADLARTYLQGSTVQTRLGIDTATLTTWRDEKKLLGIWHEPVRAWLYPDFQFDRGGLIEEMPELLAAFGRYHDHVWANTWGIVEWFMSANALLDGHLPMDLLASDPRRVLRVAQQELWEDPATLW